MLWTFGTRNHFLESQQHEMDAAHLFTFPTLCVVIREVVLLHKQNEVRDAFGDLSALAWSQVRNEPVIREANTQCNTPDLIGDLAVRGVWKLQTEA